MLEQLVAHIRSGIAAPQVHKLGLNVRIGWAEKGRDAAIRAIDLARSAGIREVSIDGIIRKEADRALSFPGLTNYLTPDLVAEVLRHARQNGVRVHPLVQVDPDTIARSIWSTLNTARGMSLHLGKYGVYPLTLEECRSVVSQVQPWFPDWAAAPVLRWHRAGFRSYWRWKSRKRAGRPRIDRELRDLIRRMSQENPLWGAPRIHGELLKLGFEVAESTVSKYMVKRRGPPSQSWRTFLRNHREAIAAIDLCLVPTVHFERLFAFIIIGHGRRQLLWFAVT
jgi:hypothetical protein